MKTPAFLSLFLATLVSLLPFQSEATPTESYYLSLYGAANFLQNTDQQFAGGTSEKSRFDLGTTGSMAFGYRWINWMRTEVELGYRYAPLKSDQISGTTFVGDGWNQTYSGFVNVLYDFDLFCGGHPFVGGGVGWTWIHLKDKSFGAPQVDDKDLRWAFQGIAGYTIPISCNYDFSLEYRYLQASDPRFSSISDGTFVSSYRIHSLGLNLKLYF